MTITTFDILCPQHLCFENDGIITHVGPGLRSVISPAEDQPLFGLLTNLCPLGISDLPTLFAHAGRDERVTLPHRTFAGGKNVGRGTSAFRHINGSAQSVIPRTDIGSFGAN